MKDKITLSLKIEAYDMYVLRVSHYAAVSKIFPQKYKFSLHFKSYAVHGTACVLSSTNYYNLENCINDAYVVMHTALPYLKKTLMYLIDYDLPMRRVIQWTIYEINVKYILALQTREDLFRRTFLPLPCESRGEHIREKLGQLQSRQSQIPRFNRDAYIITFEQWKDFTIPFT